MNATFPLSNQRVKKESKKQPWPYHTFVCEWRIFKVGKSKEKSRKEEREPTSIDSRLITRTRVIFGMGLNEKSQKSRKIGLHLDRLDEL